MDAVPERFDHTVPVPGLTDPAAKIKRKLLKQKGPQDVNPAAPRSFRYSTMVLSVSYPR